jgi:hypothetical protein
MTEMSVPRRRGRPPGSRNKPKPPPVVAQLGPATYGNELASSTLPTHIEAVAPGQLTLDAVLEKPVGMKGHSPAWTPEGGGLQVRLVQRDRVGTEPRAETVSWPPFWRMPERYDVVRWGPFSGQVLGVEFDLDRNLVILLLA